MRNLLKNQCLISVKIKVASALLEKARLQLHEIRNLKQTWVTLSSFIYRLIKTKKKGKLKSKCFNSKLWNFKTKCNLLLYTLSELFFIFLYQKLTDNSRWISTITIIGLKNLLLLEMLYLLKAYRYICEISNILNLICHN